MSKTPQFIIVVFICIAFVFFYINNKKVEGFTPKLRQMVRPHLRNWQHGLTNTLQTFENSSKRFLRKADII
jgi:hypothetical protein